MTPDAFITMPGVTEVPASSVPAFIEAGITVFAYGYGEADYAEDGSELFDAIEASDLWAWTPEEGDPAIVAEWGPFIADVAELTHINAHHIEGDPACDWCRAAGVGQ